MGASTVERIKIAYEREQFGNQVAIGANDDLPLSHESISPQWLTGVLCPWMVMYRSCSAHHSGLPANHEAKQWEVNSIDCLVS